jgi:YD repeat-containing protein
MPKTIMLTVLAFAMLTSHASAQQQRYFDSSGRSLGTASTESQGTTTFRDADGHVTGRESRSGNTTTIYDDRGRNVGRATSR